MADTSNPSWPPPFDQERAGLLVGKTILVGLTYLDGSGLETRRTQFYGVVACASTRGVLVELRGTRQGQSFNLPPALDAITEAASGDYRLRETGEIVTDPDLLTTWEIKAPPGSSSDYAPGGWRKD